MQKNVAIVAPHFVPSNLTAVHRARLLAAELPAFGWTPIIVTVHDKYYEERPAPDLADLVPRGLEIRRAKAFPVKPLRIVGDIGIRGFAGMYGEIARLHAERRMDFLYVTIPSNYAALLGRLAHDRLGVPYGIDYIDPWVHEWPEARVRFSKAWCALRLSRLLEPFAVRRASLITGVASGYYAGVLERNPRLRHDAVTAEMPYGWSDADYAAVKRRDKDPFLFSQPAAYRMVYAGAMLPQAYAVLERLLGAIKRLCAEEPKLMEGFRLHFIGTGKSPDDETGFNVRPYAERHGLQDKVIEHPARIGYVDALNHQLHADGILVLGSTEPHYTPSKLFQAVASGKPVLCIVHARSTAAEMARRSGAGAVVTFEGAAGPSEQETAAALKAMLAAKGAAPAADMTVFEEFSARRSAQVLAKALDEALRRRRQA